MISATGSTLMTADAARGLHAHYSRLSSAAGRLSSGLRIAAAGDDPAGLSVRELQRLEIASLHQGIRNANDAIGLIQIADGALAVIDEKLIRLRELAEQAATGTYTSAQRLMLDAEFQAMRDEIDRIAAATEFNGIKLLEGVRGPDAPDFLSLQVAHFSFDGSLDDEFGSTPGQAANPGGISYVDGPPGSDRRGVRLEGHGGAAADGRTPAGSSISLPEIDWDALAHGVTVSIWVREEDLSAPAEGSSYVAFGGSIVRIYRRNGPWTDMDGNAQHGDYVEYRMGDNVIRTAFDPATQQDRWILHTMTLDDRELVVYQNDREVARLAARRPLANPADPAQAANNAVNRHWWTNTSSASRVTMAAADLRIHDRVLEADEIRAMYEYDTGRGARTDLHLLIHFGGRDADEGRQGIGLPIVSSGSLGLRGISIRTQDAAQAALGRIGRAVERKDAARAGLGAMRNRLEGAVAAVAIRSGSLQAAESRISDADVASEMAGFVRSRILADSAAAVLSQANTLARMAMQIIDG